MNHKSELYVKLVPMKLVDDFRHRQIHHIHHPSPHHVINISQQHPQHSYIIYII